MRNWLRRDAAPDTEPDFHDTQLTQDSDEPAGDCIRRPWSIAELQPAIVMASLAAWILERWTASHPIEPAFIRVESISLISFRTATQDRSPGSTRKTEQNMPRWKIAPMKSSRSRLLILLIALQASVSGGVAAEDPRDPAALFPETTALLAEIPKPAALVTKLAEHPLVAQLQDHPLVQQVLNSPQYAQAQAPRLMVEAQLQMKWHEALAALTQQYAGVAVDSRDRSVTVIIRGRDAELMEKVRASFLELTRLGNPLPEGENEYRGVSLYRIGGARAMVVRDWLILSTSAETGRGILDRLLEAEESASLSLSTSLQACRKTAVSSSADLRVLLDLNAVKQARPFMRAATAQAPNPLVELLLGGIQTVVRDADWAGAGLNIADESLSLSAILPLNPDEIPPERRWFFGPDSAGTAASLPQVPDMIATAALYRDASQMWLYSGDLFSERTNDQIAAAESVLATLFSGRDFGEEVLGLLGPEIRIVVARQNPEALQPRPTVLFPAFAIVVPLKDPETMWPELRRTFQSLLGFVNVTGAQEGRPQLDYETVSISGGSMLTSSFVAPAEKDAAGIVPVLYNFSPTAASAQGELILSSSRSLAVMLADALEGHSDPEPAHTSLSVAVSPLQRILQDNQPQITANSMLEKGLSQTEADAEFHTLMSLAELFQSVDFGISAAAETQALQARLKIALRRAQSEQLRESGVNR